MLHAGAWTGLTRLGASVGVIALVSMGLFLKVFNFPTLGFGWEHAARIYIWAFALALLSSVAGAWAWAWNSASRRLPMILMGQLISIETVFATAFGLNARHQQPTVAELLGTSMLIMGSDAR